MTSKAEKRRRRPKGGRPRKEGAREPSGRPKREDVRLVVIEARQRHGEPMDAAAIRTEAKALASALEEREPEDRAAAVAAIAARVKAKRKRAALDPLQGSDMGRCIAVHPDRETLAQAWGALSAAHRAFRTRIIGKTGDPQGATIAMLPEKIDIDPSLRVDLRTSEEKDDAAARGWASWQASIRALPTPQHKWAITGALDGFLGGEALWRHRAPTPVGKLAVAALALMVA
jgi:hypothetical protein